MTATAPASSAILACSGSTTSMITPPLSISARPRFTRERAGLVRGHASAGHGPDRTVGDPAGRCRNRPTRAQSGDLADAGLGQLDPGLARA